MNHKIYGISGARFAEEYNSQVSASTPPQPSGPGLPKRLLTFQERFSFFLFIGKFVLSKFGLFFLFILIHAGSRYSQGSYGIHFSSKLDSKHSFTNSLLVKRTLKSNSGFFPSPNLTPKLDSHSISNLYFVDNKIFHKIRNYCIIGTIVTLFLNPQQTKYFGGLAVVLKQAGFFTKYSKSEKMVYIFSWVFVILFFSSSIQIAALTHVSSLQFLKV